MRLSFGGPSVTYQSIQTTFSQDLRIPYFGEAYLACDERRPSWLRFLHAEVRRTDSTANQHGELDGGVGDIIGFTLRIGRWHVTVDRPRVELTGTTKDPLAWNTTAWATLGAPAVVLSVIAAGLFKSFVAKPFGWVPDRGKTLLLEL